MKNESPISIRRDHGTQPGARQKSHIRFLAYCMALFGAATNAAPPVSYAEFSKGFRCPESLPTDQARKDALGTFLKWARQNEPGITIEKVVELRTRLLNEHNCAQTLANIRESVPGGENGAPRNLCAAADGMHFFSKELVGQCRSVPIELGWVNFRSDPKFIVDVLPSKLVKEPDGIKIWSQTFLADPIASGQGWSYDYAKVITKLFCDTKQQLLIQGTYSLNGKVVHERLSNEAIMEEIEPGTIAEGLHEYACKK